MKQKKKCADIVVKKIQDLIAKDVDWHIIVAKNVKFKIGKY